MDKEKRRLKRKKNHKAKVESRKQSIVAGKRQFIAEINAKKQAFERANSQKGINTQNKPKLKLEDHII